MAAVFRYIRLVPAAIRVTLAGGVTYGTVKAGAWSDSSDSREKLDKVQESIQSIKEIEYPPMEHTNIAQVTAQQQLAVSEEEMSGLRSSLTQSWNSAVKSACQAVVSEDSSGQNLLSGNAVSRGIKSVTEKFSEWTK